MLKTAVLALAALFVMASAALACSCVAYRDAEAHLAEVDVATVPHFGLDQ